MTMMIKIDINLPGCSKDRSRLSNSVKYSLGFLPSSTRSASSLIWMLLLSKAWQAESSHTKSSSSPFEETAKKSKSRSFKDILQHKYMDSMQTLTLLNNVALLTAWLVLIPVKSACPAIDANFSQGITK